VSTPNLQLPTPKESPPRESIGSPWELGVGHWELARGLVVSVALSLLSACSWWQGDKALITARLNALVEQVNVHAADGLGSLARAAQIGQFFTDDVIVELGRGSAPITGRDTLMALAARLEPRTSGFTVKLADINVLVTPNDQSADVNLTAEIIRKASATPEAASAGPSMDAREFAVIMRKVDGEWKVARLTAVDTLK
jgi:hypothetical protein